MTSERHPPKHETIHIKCSFYFYTTKVVCMFHVCCCLHSNMYICPELSDRCFDMFAGLLRYKVDFQSLQCDEFEDDLYDIDDY